MLLRFLIDSFNENPTKQTLNISKGTSDEQSFFSWKVAGVWADPLTLYMSLLDMDWAETSV